MLYCSITADHISNQNPRLTQRSCIPPYFEVCVYTTTFMSDYYVPPFQRSLPPPPSGLWSYDYGHG